MVNFFDITITKNGNTDNRDVFSYKDTLQCRDALQCVSTKKQQNSNPPEKFKNKYRIKSTRLQGYDYSSNGAYFITICTANREHFFGEIISGKIELSEMGKIVANEWQKTAGIRKNVTLGEWIVMPNHFHGILIIENDDFPVETHCNASLPPNKSYKNKFGPQKNNVSSIIRGFKGTVTKQIHISGYEYFAWQTRFHDHIIRNKKEFEKISQYIKYNPQKWENDCYFKDIA